MGAINRQGIPLQSLTALVGQVCNLRPIHIRPAILALLLTSWAHAQTYDLAWSPNGKLIALAGFKEVRLGDESLKGAADAVRAVVFSKDGTLLAAAGGLPGRAGEVQIWGVADRKLIRTIKGHSDCIYGVAFSPDGKTIATSSYDKFIKLWDLSDGKEIRTFKDHIDAVYAV
ncbi:MAG TPA: hypothetical protein VLV86_11795, partial [Vicinamibacterales bacterium]|nr:hypothetical protein [Vicinamibacterales bacterium]